VYHVIEPGAFVIGGGIGKAGEALSGFFWRTVAAHHHAVAAARIDVVPAARGDDSMRYGAEAG